MGTASPASRTTTINWTTPSVTTGQFPMSVTDPSGAQPQFNYNFGYGVVSSTTDPNSLTTSWQYTDGFGRRTQENRPDGTYTKWAYTDCASSGCLVGGHGLDNTQSVYAVGGAVITDGTTYDAAGSKTGVTDSLGNTLWSGTYNYGLAPFPATTSDMDLGNWSYTVDALGEATAWRDAKGRSFSATYDAISRLLTRSEPDF